MSRPVTTALQTWGSPAPAVAANTGVHAAITLPASSTTVVTTAITNPDVPRTLRLKGNQASVQGLTGIIIAGTDILGNAISETVTMGGAFATPTDTVNAFKTVTSITVPTQGASGDTISVGLGAALGLDNYCSADSFGSKSSITSFAFSTTVISLNVVTLSQTLDGSTTQYATYHPAIFAVNGGSRA
jgi:hypothetical protein